MRGVVIVRPRAPSWGWLDERQSGADRLCVIDTVTGIEVLAGHDLHPGAHVVEPLVDIVGELVVGSEPRLVVVAWAFDVGHGHAMKGGGWPKRLGICARAVSTNLINRRCFSRSHASTVSNRSNLLGDQLSAGALGKPEARCTVWFAG
jgi:hypothetical protein